MTTENTSQKITIITTEQTSLPVPIMGIFGFLAHREKLRKQGHDIGDCTVTITEQIEVPE